jgi:hypothetical protein
VILDGNYMTTVIITIMASNVTISDITLRRALYHPIHVVPPVGMSIVNTRIHNIHIIDPGEQGIKISSRSGYFADDGEIACSRIELTDAGRAKVIACYTGGVSAQGARGWVIRDNVIEGFWCEFGLPGHAILLWTGSRDTIVERNVLIDNARGIGFGFVQYGSGRTYDDDPCPDVGYVGHYGGIIRNNFVFQNREDLRDSEDGFNCGICLSQACGTKVLHNTVVSTAPPTSSIECRYPNTDATITNNLISRNLLVQDGASVTLAGNLDHQPLSLFIDGAGGDLHLAEHAHAAVDQGTPIGDGLCVDDIDTDIRGFRPDVGADEIVKECAADLEGDGDVDGSDLAGFAADFNTTWNTSHLQSFAMEFGLADCSD